MPDGSIIAFDVKDKLVRQANSENYKTTLIAKESVNKPLKDELKKAKLPIEFKLIGSSGKLFPMKTMIGNLKKI